MMPDGVIVIIIIVRARIMQWAVRVDHQLLGRIKL